MSEKHEACGKKDPASFCEMRRIMGDFAPNTLKAIKDLTPGFVDIIRDLDEAILSDGALDMKTKRLIALACVCVRACDDCVYAQAKVAKNYGATRAEILEAVQVAVLTGGVPSWSIAKKGIVQLFSEWDEEEGK
ncbi:MAG: carboxymuconolactone decarboxylase family protein [Candidatus Methanomethylophilaceae archaeon]|jgi:4-carboxymuconolactone decarboxylase